MLLAVLAKAFPGSSPSLGAAAERYDSSRQHVKQVALGLQGQGFVRLEAPTEMRDLLVLLRRRLAPPAKSDTGVLR